MKLTFSTPEALTRAVKAGLTVHWSNTGYTVVPSHDGLQINHHNGSTVGIHWPSYPVNQFFATVSNDASDFLNAFLRANEPEGTPETWADDEEPPYNADLYGRTVYDFAPEIYAGLETFISGFRAYLEAQGVGSDDLDTLERSFGGNVYLSLSGHGCGFWDDRSEIGDTVQAHLEKYSGEKCRFEEMDFSNDETGLLDLAFIPSARKEYRDKLFAVPTATPAAL